MPDLNGISDKQDSPQERNRGIHALSDLNDFTTVMPVCQRAKINRKEQKWCPMTDHGESAKYRRVKFLIEEPIADDVLDIIGHHGQHGADEIVAKVTVMERRKGDLLVDRGEISTTYFLRYGCQQ